MQHKIQRIVIFHRKVLTICPGNVRQQLEARNHVYEELKGLFQSLHNLVLTLLPPDHHTL